MKERSLSGRFEDTLSRVAWGMLAKRNFKPFRPPCEAFPFHADRLLSGSNWERFGTPFRFNHLLPDSTAVTEIAVRRITEASNLRAREGDEPKIDCNVLVRRV